MRCDSDEKAVNLLLAKQLIYDVKIDRGDGGTLAQIALFHSRGAKTRDLIKEAKELFRRSQIGERLCARMLF